MNGGSTLNVTTSSSDTLALGNIYVNSTSNYTLDAAAGAHLTIAGFTSSSGINDTVNFGGAGEIDVLGEIQHTTSARYLVLNFNQAGTVALWGSDSLKANNVNGAYHPSVNLNSGTTVLNNSNARTAPTVPFVTFGATSGGSPATLLLGGTDSAGLTGGISTNDNGATIDVEDLTTGLLTIGGQNTSGVNTVSNNIQLGVSSNTGKSVTLVAAPGGEVLFSGELLSNGTNTTAGGDGGQCLQHRHCKALRREHVRRRHDCQRRHAAAWQRFGPGPGRPHGQQRHGRFGELQPDRHQPERLRRYDHQQRCPGDPARQSVRLDHLQRRPPGWQRRCAWRSPAAAPAS